LPHIDALGGTQPEFAPYKPIRLEDQARVLLDANVPAFSFI
jgi:nitronate monooxygenase